jgi:hypothetical protein
MGRIATTDPLGEHRQFLIRILELLSESHGAEMRADLANELTRVGAQYEDVLERALYPRLDDLIGTHLALEARKDIRAVRESLVRVRRRLHYVKPINAHLQEPSGFERDLSALVDAFKRQLSDEDDHLIPLLGKMGEAEARELTVALRRAEKHASTSPRQHRHLSTRMLSGLWEKVDGRFEDSSTTCHPGVYELRRPERPE